MKSFNPKIVIVTIGFYPNIGGLETHLTDLTNELSKRYQILVTTMPPISTRVPAKTIESINENLSVWRIPWFGKGLFYKLMHSPVLEFFYLTPPLFIGLLVALIKYPSIQVVHAQGLSGGLTGVILGKLFNKRVLISTHYVFNFKQNFFGWFSKLVFSSVDRVLCVSLGSRDEMLALGIPKDRLGRCAYWIDMEMFKPMPKDKAKIKLGWEGKFSVFFIGRLVEEKGLIPLLKSIPSISKDINIYIAGDGPLNDEIVEASLKYNNLHFLGRIDNTLTPLYYNAADLVVVPSFNETLGRVSMEALSCATPVVASSAGGISEVVSDEVGILFDVNPKLIAESINKLYSDRKLYRKMAENARGHISKNWSKRNVEVFVKEYAIK